MYSPDPRAVFFFKEYLVKTCWSSSCSPWPQETTSPYITLYDCSPGATYCLTITVMTRNDSSQSDHPWCPPARTLYLGNIIWKDCMYPVHVLNHFVFRRLLLSQHPQFSTTIMIIPTVGVTLVTSNSLSGEPQSAPGYSHHSGPEHKQTNKVTMGSFKYGSELCKGLKINIQKAYIK